MDQSGNPSSSRLPFGATSTADFESQEQEFPREPRFWVWVAIALTCLFWGLAVALPVWETRSNQTGEWGTVPGYFPALLGWLGALVMCPAWFANLLLVPLFVLLFKRSFFGFVLSLVTLAVAASAYAMPGIYGDNDEAVIMRRLIGFYLWLGSFVVIALAFAFLAHSGQRKTITARIAVLIVIVLGVVALEWVRPIGVSALETSLKNPDDLTAFTAALNRNPSQTEKDGALWWAIRQELSQNRREPSKRVTMLLAAGANPNKAEKGDTVLMRSLRSEKFVEVLVHAGADVNARDWRGKTILEMAKECGSSPEIQKILVDAGARESHQGKE